MSQNEENEELKRECKGEKEREQNLQDPGQTQVPAQPSQN